jgi:hypothetical protein
MSSEARTEKIEVSVIEINSSLKEQFALQFFILYILSFFKYSFFVPVIAN